MRTRDWTILSVAMSLDFVLGIFQIPPTVSLIVTSMLGVYMTKIMVLVWVSESVVQTAVTRMDLILWTIQNCGYAGISPAGAIFIVWLACLSVVYSGRFIFRKLGTLERRFKIGDVCSQ